MFQDGRVTVRSHFLLHYKVSNIVFKLPTQRPPLIRMKPKFVIRTSIGRMIPTNGMLTPHTFGVSKLTIRCASVTTTSTSPRHVIKTAVQAHATVLVTMSTLGLSLYNAMKNILNLKLRIIIVMAELRRNVVCRTMGGLGPSICLVYIKLKDVAQSLIICLQTTTIAGRHAAPSNACNCLPPSCPSHPHFPTSLYTHPFLLHFSFNQSMLPRSRRRQAVAVCRLSPFVCSC
jgi:hypothetical protein